MTAIVGISKDGKVWMGADSLVSNPDTVDLMSESKIYKVGHMYMADAGSIFPGQAIKYRWEPPIFKRSDSGDDVMEYLCKKVVPSLKKFVEDEGLEERDEDDILMGISALIALEGRLFELELWSIMESKFGFSAIGSGSEVARGSLYTTRNWRNQKRRVVEALVSCEALLPTVRRPWVIVET